MVMQIKLIVVVVVNTDTFVVKKSPPSGRPGNDTAKVFVYIELDL